MAVTAFLASFMTFSKSVPSVATRSTVASEVERIKFLFGVRKTELDESE